MSMVNGVVASVAGGVVGALVWAGVSTATDREIGWIAWGIGALAGYGMSLGLRGAGDKASGIVAAVIAIVSVFAGKYAAVHFAVHRSLSEFVGSPVSDEQLCVVLADQVVGEWEGEGRALQWPRGMTIDQAQGPKDYPPGVWDEASARFEAVAASDREQLRQEVAAARDASLRGRESAIASEGFQESLGPFDLLWAFLAVGTAFRLGSRSKVAPAEAPAT